MIKQETCNGIWCCYREIEIAEKLLKEVREVIESQKDSFKEEKCLRDVFGKKHHHLQLGVPSGENGHRLFYVNYELSIPIISAHINTIKAKLAALNEVAKSEVVLNEKQAQKEH